MKAIVCEKYKDSDGLVVTKVKTPTINKKELLINILASTVSSGDCVVKNASNPFVRIIFGLRKPRNLILGTDLAGVVVKVGEDVQNFKVGDRIIAATGMKFGCHAEYITLHEKQALAKIPQSLSYNEAATLSFGGLAGLHYLKKIPASKKKKYLSM